MLKTHFTISQRRFENTSLQQVHREVMWGIKGKGPRDIHATYHRHPSANNMVRHNFDQLKRPEIQVRHKMPAKNHPLESAATLRVTQGKTTKTIHLCVPKGKVMGEVSKAKT